MVWRTSLEAPQQPQVAATAEGNGAGGSGAAATAVQQPQQALAPAVAAAAVAAAAPAAPAVPVLRQPVMVMTPAVVTPAVVNRFELAQELAIQVGGAGARLPGLPPTVNRICSMWVRHYAVCTCAANPGALLVWPIGRYRLNG